MRRKAYTSFAAKTSLRMTKIGEKDRSLGVCTSDLPQHIHSVQRSFGRLFVLEVGKHIAAFGKMLLHAIHHRAPLFSAIRRLAKAVVSELPRYHIGRGASLRFGNA